jgi:hypothetical protein
MPVKSNFTLFSIVDVRFASRFNLIPADLVGWPILLQQTNRDRIVSMAA